MPADLENKSQNQGVMQALFVELQCRVSKLKTSFENFDNDGNIEHVADIIQKLYYAIALASVIRSDFTPNGIKGSLGLLWVYLQDLWNVISVIFAMIYLPRMHREKNNLDTASALKSFIFYCNAIFFPFLLLPATIACIASSTRDATEEDFNSVFFNSTNTLGNTYILFLGTLFYGVGMMICALTPLDNLLIARAKLLANSVPEKTDTTEKTPLNIQASQVVLIDPANPSDRVALTEQEIAGLNLKIRLNVLNLFRDLMCAAGADFGAASMLKHPEKFLLAAMILYGVSTVINVGQGAHKLAETGVFGSTCKRVKACCTPVFPHEITDIRNQASLV